MRFRAALLIALLPGMPADARDEQFPPAESRVERIVLEAQVEGRTIPVDLTIDDDLLAAAGPVWWREQFSRIGTGYLRFHVAQPEARGPTGAVLQFDGGAGRSFSYEVDQIGPEGLWTGLLPGGLAVISLLAETRPQGLTLAIDRVSFEAETGAPFSVWGDRNEMLHINAPEVPPRARELGRAVAKLVFQQDGLPRTCTGFLISENRLLTNEHCINDAESCRSMVALFGYEFDASNGLQFGEQFFCAGQGPERVSYEFDASVVLLTGAPGARFGSISLEALESEPEQPLMVVQHPAGGPKQISFIECRTLAIPVNGRAADSDFTHTCDTAGGSSGAPVLDAEGRLVGLHHYGFKDGQVDDWTENRAVRMDTIRSWIGSNGMAGD